MPRQSISIVACCFLISEFGFAEKLFRDEFRTSTDIADWHFETEAMEENRPSDFLLAPKIGGKDSSTGGIYVDSVFRELVILPRANGRPHRCVFLGVHALSAPTEVRHLTLDFPEGPINPSATDSVGGLFPLIQFQTDKGIIRFARSIANVVHWGTPLLFDSLPLYRLTQNNFIKVDSSGLLNAAEKNEAFKKIVGVGFVFITALHSIEKLEPLELRGFHVDGLLLERPKVVPQESLVCVGDSVRLSVYYQGITPPGWKWQFTGRPVPVGTPHSLAFQSLPADTGIQKVVFSLLHDDSTWTSDTASVRILPVEPTRIVIQPRSTEAHIGESLTLKIQATGTGALRYQWLKDDSLVQDGYKSDLEISDASLIHGGKYYCRVLSRNSKVVKSDTVTLLIHADDLQSGLFSGLEYSTINYGFTLGLSNTDFFHDTQNSIRSDRLWFPTGGLFSEVGFTKNLFGIIAMQFSRKGAKYRFNSFHTKQTTLDYLEMPLMAKSAFALPIADVCISVIGGGYGAWLIRSEDRHDWGNDLIISESPQYQNFDWGITGGFGVSYLDFHLEFRYSQGLTSIASVSESGKRTNGALSTSWVWTMPSWPGRGK